MLQLAYPGSLETKTIQVVENSLGSSCTQPFQPISEIVVNSSKSPAGRPVILSGHFKLQRETRNSGNTGPRGPVQESLATCKKTD